MQNSPERDRLLDAVHRRSLALAKLTAPGHTGRMVDPVIAFTAGNLVQTLIVVLGEPLLKDLLGRLLTQADVAAGLCPFCRNGALIRELHMCQACVDQGELAVDLDEPTITDANATPVRKDGCGKACYATQGKADGIIRSAKQSDREERWKGRVHSYFCRPCRAWHVGHTEWSR